MSNVLTVSQGEFKLYREPLRKRELLQAWDAADEYVLNYLVTTKMEMEQKSVVVMNDNFGAITVGLAPRPLWFISDSYLSHLACKNNLERNHIPIEHVHFLTSLQLPDNKIDILIVKIPKTLALLEYQLLQLRPLLNQNSRLVFAAMVKQLSPNVWKLIERIIGPTTTSLAEKKARLIFAQLDENITQMSNPYPKCYPLEGTDFQISNHANVFSRDSLDIGTRFFLQQLPEFTGALEIIDLGCGNGVVGLSVAKTNPQATIHFVDESYMAIASAKENFFNAYANERKATFTTGNSLDDFADESADVILSNPPFHQHHVVGDHLAVMMFKQSEKVLKKGGQLWVVGNRHLQYQQKLKQFFKQVHLISQNKKFVVLQAVR